jgi:hypothetical protein
MPKHRRRERPLTELSVIDLETLLSNPLNNREHNADEVRERVARCLEERMPPVLAIDENNLVLWGYAGFQAAIELNLTRVFVSRERPPFSLAVKKRLLSEDGYSWVAQAIGRKRPTPRIH